MSLDLSGRLGRTERKGLLPANAAFDAVFIFATLVLALGLGAIASLSTVALVAVVWIDVWLFANPHLVATFTRIGTRGADVRAHWFLIFFLPVLVLSGVLATALAWEVAGLFTLYFIAQSWHVARQSRGIARSYRRVDTAGFRSDRLTEAVVYLFPAWGLSSRCAQAPEAFLGYPIHLPAVFPVVAHSFGAAAIVCGAWWLQRQVRAALNGQSGWQHDGFVVSHVCVSFVAYLWISDITVGWVVVNVWHNLQYLLFVWVQNVRRDGRAQVGLTELGGSAARYACVCLLLGAVLYQALDFTGAHLLWLGLPTVLIAHFTLNFHHYLVDSVIWKRHRSSRALRIPANDTQGSLDNIGKMH